MSSPVRYQWLPGPVGDMLRSASLATTAAIPLAGTLVTTTGHVGLDLKTGEFVTSSVEAEFNAIFDCLDAALKNAGVIDGLRSAFKIVAYFSSAQDEPTMQAIFRHRYPEHTPTWTSVVYASPINPGMRAEAEAQAIIIS